VNVSIGPEGKKILPWVFTAFVFLLFANLIGNMPFGIVAPAHPFTITAQFTFTGVMSLITFAIVLGVGFWKHGLHFFGIFAPSGVPKALLPLVASIEMISFLSRPISLSVRLFANMLAGHITLKVFAGFVASMSALGALGVGGAVLPLIMTVAMTALEFLVAFLQAYVFAVLTCMYLNDAVHGGH
jgi:F-type H+-transporting ATPase subunit a